MFYSYSSFCLLYMKYNKRIRRAVDAALRHCQTAKEVTVMLTWIHNHADSDSVASVIWHLFPLPDIQRFGSPPSHTYCFRNKDVIHPTVSNQGHTSHTLCMYVCMYVCLLWCQSALRMCAIHLVHVRTCPMRKHRCGCGRDMDICEERVHAYKYVC